MLHVAVDGGIDGEGKLRMNETGRCVKTMVHCVTKTPVVYTHLQNWNV